FVNGLFARIRRIRQLDDFFFNGLNIARSTNNKVGSNVTLLICDKLSETKYVRHIHRTHRLRLAWLESSPLAPTCKRDPHVLEGTLYVGFVTSNEANGGHQLFTKVLNEGDVFVVPRGLIHFQLNLANKASRGPSRIE
ncbi:hypothetical protein Dimus_030876, partial [Dionaea muscipula]